MSDTTIAALVTLVVIAGLFAWVPFVHGCAHCHRVLRSRRDRKAFALKRPPMSVESFDRQP